MSITNERLVAMIQPFQKDYSAKSGSFSILWQEPPYRGIMTPQGLKIQEVTLLCVRQVCFISFTGEGIIPPQGEQDLKIAELCLETLKEMKLK